MHFDESKTEGKGYMYISDRLPKESARDFAFRTLKDNIVSLELKPGTLISENEIAMELGVSRTPVREAIIDLAKAGIIEILPQRGSYVSLIDPNMVEESRFVRKTLDKAVIELACEVAPMEVIEELVDDAIKATDRSVAASIDGIKEAARYLRTDKGFEEMEIGRAHV